MVFLDRDGVINQDSPEYVKNWSEFKFIPGSLDAIRRLTETGHVLIVITNQSAVGRKLITPEILMAMHQNLCDAVTETGGRITDIFFCPHLPEDRCGCRKPLPGLIHQAVRQYDIDLADAVMIGDSTKDIECGKNAGCKTLLVLTGNGSCTIQELARTGMVPDTVTADLKAAAEWIIAR